MSKEIIVTISDGGKMQIDAQGYSGKGCKQATEFLEKALNVTGGADKPEINKREVTKCQQH